MAREEQTFEFIPTSIGTLSLLTGVYEQVGENPVETFHALLSSTLVAAAIIKVEPEALSQIVAMLLPHATQAIEENPQIFSVTYADDEPAGGTLQ